MRHNSVYIRATALDGEQRLRPTSHAAIDSATGLRRNPRPGQSALRDLLVDAVLGVGSLPSDVAGDTVAHSLRFDGSQLFDAPFVLLGSGEPLDGAGFDHQN